MLFAMKTEFYESDPFSPRKADLLVSFDSDYRFEKGDEVVIDRAGEWVLHPYRSAADELGA